jgi:flavodoxin
MSAAVIFSSRFGTTEKIAKSLQRGLKEANFATFCRVIEGTAPESLKEYDLVCVGGPTEMLGATKPVKEFLRSVRGTSLAGKFGFAFDTKLDSHFSGSAAKYIEHTLDDLGLRVVARRESAIVTARREAGKITGAILKAGEEDRFEELGVRIGILAAEAMAKISPQ